MSKEPKMHNAQNPAIAASDIERPTGAGTPVGVSPIGPVIPASPALPPPPVPGTPLTVPPVDGQRVLIDGKVPGIVRSAHNKPVAPHLYAVESAAHSKGCPIVRYPLSRLYPTA